MMEFLQQYWFLITLTVVGGALVYRAGGRRIRELKKDRD
jgi:hypothetical protein